MNRLCYQCPRAENHLPDTDTITGPSSVRNNFLSVDGQSYDEKLADRIKRGVEKCVCRGQTREGISEAMGYESTSSLSKWEKGHATPGAENLGKLSKATGLALNWLVTGRGPMFAQTEADAVRLEVIGRVVDGEIDEETVRLLAATPPASEDETPEERAARLEAGREAREQVREQERDLKRREERHGGQ